MIQWHGSAAFSALQEAAAAGLLRAVILLENEHRQRISTPNPPPYKHSSQPGEYMRLRTGAGQKALTHEPQSLAEIARTGNVRVGFRQGDGDHMVILELYRQRLGIQRTLEDMRTTLANAVTAEFNR